MKPVQSPQTWRQRLLAPIKLLVKFLIFLEQQFYKFREILWNYPDYLFFGPNSAAKELYKLYRFFNPYSYALIAVLGVGAVALFVLTTLAQPLNAQTQGTLIEGVVMGTTEEGLPQRLAKVNPVVPSNIQLEKDLSELIYEPLIRYEQDGEITNVLVEQIIRRQEGAEYIFEIKEDVYWHDGEPFEVEDAIATFNLIQLLADDEELNENAYIKAIGQMGWEKTGEREFAICTLSAQDLETFRSGELERPCTGTTAQKPILSNFLELIAVKMMPAHLIGNLNPLNINQPEVPINRSPVGTGPYMFQRGTETEINLTTNPRYHKDGSTIKNIKFKLFSIEDEALRALQAGEIHSLVTPSTINLAEIQEFPQIQINTSDVLTNQYWALYFNLKKNPDGEALGPSFFQDKDIRRAINQAINKERIADELLTVGRPAVGPIYLGSEFFNKDANWPTYDPVAAAKTLVDKGWLPADDGVRTKDDQKMSFTLSYVDNYDREITVNAIVDDLKQIGVEVIPDPRQPREMVNDVVASKTFDTLLYGMRTFLDPDRYELFYSKETGLSNLSSFVGSVDTVKIEDGEKIRLPRIDRYLEVGRSLDPLKAKEERKSTYFDFQTELALDMPAVFLYHPQFLYYTHNNLQNVNLDNVKSIEERFKSIADWKIVI